MSHKVGVVNMLSTLCCLREVSDSFWTIHNVVQECSSTCVSWCRSPVGLIRCSSDNCCRTPGHLWNWLRTALHMTHLNPGLREIQRGRSLQLHQPLLKQPKLCGATPDVGSNVGLVLFYLVVGFTVWHGQSQTFVCCFASVNSGLDLTGKFYRLLATVYTALPLHWHCSVSLNLYFHDPKFPVWQYDGIYGHIKPSY